MMGRHVQYDDIYHAKERTRVQRFRTLHAGVMPKEAKPTIMIKPIAKKEIMIDDQRIASIVRYKKCTSCKDQVGCIIACEEYKRMYEYERMKQTLKQ